MAIEVITFDLDNTLWDVEPTLIKAEEAQRAWLLEHRPGTIEQYSHEQLWEFRKGVWQRNPHLAHHISDMRRQMLFELQQQAGFGEAESRQGAEQAFEVFLQVRHAVELYEEALEVLEALARDYVLGALTNGNADIYKTDAGEYFDFAFLAEDIGASKPAPDMFHAAVEQAGVAPDRIAHVGDNAEHDVEGARAVGMHTVWMNSQGVPWPGGVRADKEIENLRQLPEAVAALAAR